MKYPHDSQRITGILTPLAALRSAESVGTGEFADLIPLAEWCKTASINLIQLLPVNDTGRQSSPYSALSAYALHPLYGRIRDLPEFHRVPGEVRNAVDQKLAQMREEHEKPSRFDYQTVLADKMGLYAQIYQALEGEIVGDKQLTTFVRNNPWVKAYSVYRALKDRKEQKPWWQWDELRNPTAADVDAGWRKNALKSTTRFYAWLQLRLAEQFALVSQTLDSMGIALKGDIPIMMNEDSADVWSDREIFDTSLRAGAPPDMFSDLGQNWDFPTYDWDRLTERDYDWWRERLRVAARFFHAYRIDHVLGFFRIWAIPAGNYSGIPGFFWPQAGIGRDELNRIGFDDGRIRWLREPHIPGDRLQELLGDDLTTLLDRVLVQLSGEDLYNFSPDVKGERQLAALDVSDAAREYLLDQYRNRALLPLPDGRFAPQWNFRDCDRFRSLSDQEKEQFEQLVAAKSAANELLWQEHGTRLLEFMKDTTEMLACAEDLGVIPEAVPRTLEALHILGLRIPRWTREWDAPMQPFIPLELYPENSVCAPSVHDTSTMRAWWEQEDGRDALWRLIGQTDECPGEFTADVAHTLYRALAGANSRILVFQLQDFLPFTPEMLSDDPEQERINIPGSYNDFNWTYRFPIAVEDLGKRSDLTEEIRAIVSARDPE